jgi:hypothetical protein
MSHRCRCMHFASKNGFRIVEGLFLGFVDRSGLHGHSQEPLCGYRAKDKTLCRLAQLDTIHKRTNGKVLGSCKVLATIMDFSVETKGINGAGLEKMFGSSQAVMLPACVFVPAGFQTLAGRECYGSPKKIG